MTDSSQGDLVPVTSAAPTAAWEDLLDIFYAPRSVFERRKDGKYWVVLIAMIVINIVIFYLSQQITETLMDAEFARLAKQSAMTPEAAKATKAMMGKFQQLGVYLLPIGVMIGMWLAGLAIFLIGNMMGAKLNFAQGTTIAVLSSMPELLSKIFVGVQGLFLDSSSIVHKYSFAISAARFMPATASSWMLKLGAIADPFVIWGAVLLGLGAYVIGKMEKEKAAVLAVIMALLTAAVIR